MVVEPDEHEASFVRLRVRVMSRGLALIAFF